MDEPKIAGQSAWSWQAKPIDPSSPAITVFSRDDLVAPSPDLIFSWAQEANVLPVHCVDGLNMRARALSISFGAQPPRVQSYTFRVVDPPVLKKKEEQAPALPASKKSVAPSHVPASTPTDAEDDLDNIPFRPVDAAHSDSNGVTVIDDAARGSVDGGTDNTGNINTDEISDATSDGAAIAEESVEDVTSLLELPDSELDEESVVVGEISGAESQVTALDHQNQVIEQIAEALEVDLNSPKPSKNSRASLTSAFETDSDETTQAASNSRSTAAERESTKNEVQQDQASQDELPEHTWVRPPADVVKLEDRLFYMLQPSLETLITEGDLHFPFHPFNYQFHGVAFLFPRVSAVLADEMGLGKTMQAITSIRLLIHASEVRSVLLVCPKPLVSNWVREFHQWAPEIPVAVIEGDTTKREWQWNQVDAPVKIANYESLIRDRDLATQPDRHFDLIVLDESQRIKNQNGTTAQVVRSLSRTRSWALTGTPVENSPEDLVGIFEFVAPGHLHKGMKPKALGKAAADYILRRTKDKVLTDMPPKMFRDAHVELLPEQNESYQLAENDGILRLSDLGSSAKIQHVFELVLRLKQICNFDPATGESAKLERLEADMEEIAASGKKAILFSQWVGALEKIKDRLGRFGILEYHGKIPHKQREGVIQQFRSDPDKHLILMSYGAGSVGLNLQFCEYVFLFDRWWNPAIEDQAINRAHRIGAVGPVTVTRFLTTNTIEERINQVLEEKRELFDTILGGATSHRSLGLSAEEIFGLFKLKSPAGPIRYAA